MHLIILDVFMLRIGSVMDFMIFRDYISHPRCMGFLESWRFRDSLKGQLILGETDVLVWFYDFGCFG